MDLQGKIIAVLPERSGVSARGEWKAGSFVIETHDNYPKKMVFDVFGADRLAQFAIKAGEELLVSFDIDAHEYQGRWYNSIRAWPIQSSNCDARSISSTAYGFICSRCTRCQRSSCCTSSSCRRSNRSIPASSGQWR